MQFDGYRLVLLLEAAQIFNFFDFWSDQVELGHEWQPFGHSQKESSEFKQFFVCSEPEGLVVDILEDRLFFDGERDPWVTKGADLEFL